MSGFFCLSFYHSFRFIVSINSSCQITHLTKNLIAFFILRSLKVAKDLALTDWLLGNITRTDSTCTFKSYCTYTKDDVIITALLRVLYF